jgi:FRG domain
MRITRNWPEMVKEAIGKCTCGRNSELPDYQKIFKELIDPHRAKTWKSFQDWAEGLQGSWAFRGHADTTWDLETSLDRETILKYKSQSSDGVQKSGIHRRAAFHEKPLLREFQKRAHQHLSHLPGDDEIIDWLALMQHYGAPTRLLDWTLSPYVALYFAVEKSVSKKPAAVWAIDCDWALKESANSCGQFDPNLSHADLAAKMSRFVNERWASEADSCKPLGVVFPVDPHHVNERMAAQQGLLLCSPQHYPPFDIALLTMIIHDKTPVSSPVRKLTLRPQEQIAFLEKLKKMNITAASLFPGLEGFARSLAADLKIKMFEERTAAERQIASEER